MQLSLEIKEIYKVLCPKCRKKLEGLTREQITSGLVKEVLGLEGKEGKNE